MKNIRLFCSLILLVGLCGSGLALADRGHFHGHSHIGLGFYFGPPYPLYSPFYYPYPAYPPVVVVPAQPQEYIEKGQFSDPQASASQSGNYWYHCDRPEGYYPYIKDCPGGWKAEVPSPPER